MTDPAAVRSWLEHHRKIINELQESYVALTGGDEAYRMAAALRRATGQAPDPRTRGY